MKARACQQQADGHQTASRRSAKPHDTGDAPEDTPVIPSPKTRPVRDHRDAHPNATSRELWVRPKPTPSCLSIQKNLGIFQWFKFPQRPEPDYRLKQELDGNLSPLCTAAVFLDTVRTSVLLNLSLANDFTLFISCLECSGCHSAFYFLPSRRIR